jgi:HAD superfamily hydrolase (TIGR01509 family)
MISGVASARSVEGVCLDLDGVLWDTSAVHAAAFDGVCRSEGLRGVPYAELAGRSTEDAWRLILERNGFLPELAAVKALSLEKRVRAREVLKARPPLNPELAVLSSLNRADMPMALVTGSSAATVDVFLAAATSLCRFDVVVTAESVPVGKPAPDPYLVAISRLGLLPQDCWALEDSEAGLHSAVASGARAVQFRCAELGQPSSPRGVPVVATLGEFCHLVGIAQMHETSP